MSSVECAIPLVLCLFVIFVLPRLRILTGLIFTIGLLLVTIWIYNGFGFFFGFGFEIILPISVLVVGNIIVIARSRLKAKNTSTKTATIPSGSDKNLGLFYQQQGMLDLAFDKLRSLPLEDDTKDLLRGLAVEYEKKNQIKKAHEVYKLILEGEQEGEELLDRFPTSKIMPTHGFGETQENGHPGIHSVQGAKSIIGKYDISGEAGRDSTGVIFTGQNPRTGTVVKIKTVTFPGIDDSQLFEMKGRFFREAERLGRLKHPNIIEVNDYGEDQGIFYVVTEQIEGEDMGNFAKKDQLLPIRQTLGIISQIAEGLDHAHKNGVIHLRVTPDKIIRIKGTRDIKIKDFGMSWIKSGFNFDSETLDGFHFYLSPEQIAGKKVDGRSDIFSLGVMLFEMLTGTQPFTGEDMASMMLKISKEKHPSPRLINPKIPHVVEKIIDRALEKDLEKRYQTAGQMAAHLKKVAARIDELREKKKAEKVE